MAGFFADSTSSGWSASRSVRRWRRNIHEVGLCELASPRRPPATDIGSGRAGLSKAICIVVNRTTSSSFLRARGLRAPLLLQPVKLVARVGGDDDAVDRKSTRLNSSHRT